MNTRCTARACGKHLFSGYVIVSLLLGSLLALILEKLGLLTLPRPIGDARWGLLMNAYKLLSFFLFPVATLYSRVFCTSRILSHLGKWLCLWLTVTAWVSVFAYASPLRFFPFINYTTCDFLVAAVVTFVSLMLLHGLYSIADLTVKIKPDDKFLRFACFVVVCVLYFLLCQACGQLLT